MMNAAVRTSAFWTAATALPAALLAAHWLALPALALAVGGLCGILNAMLTAHGVGRLAHSRHSGPFVISSFFRIGLFGIVPVAFAASGPWWSMAWYFAGFFLPTAAYAVTVTR
ncbi:MAG: hypothetical protein ACREMP_04620 [Candidatus Tyrphobacter sp.]